MQAFSPHGMVVVEVWKKKGVNAAAPSVVSISYCQDWCSIK